MAENPFLTENPFLQESPLPYQVPPFDTIKDSDYRAAFKAGMAEELREVAAIAHNHEFFRMNLVPAHGMSPRSIANPLRLISIAKTLENSDNAPKGNPGCLGSNTDSLRQSAGRTGRFDQNQ